MNTEEQAIYAVLKKYEEALNASSTDAVMPIYTDDGVFMPQHSSSSVGTVAIRKAYNAVFGTIQLSIAFDVVEVRQISPDWAFARTYSAGTVKVLANGMAGPEANQELFLFQKIEGIWKIARYCFSTTNPPRV